MAEETKKPSQTDNGATNGGSPDVSTAAEEREMAEGAQAAPGKEGGPLEDAGVLATKLDELNAQKADLTDRLVRAHAEIQNLHKRLEREREETSKYAIAKFARDTVAVADNFERAILSVPEEALSDNPMLKNLLDGVTMTEREFLNVLEKHGVVRVDPKGEPFDPHKHQAMMEQEDASVSAGTVLQVFQPGYMIGDRVLRPAMVVVAKGGPKAASPAAEPAPKSGAADQPEGTANGAGPSDEDEPDR